MNLIDLYKKHINSNPDGIELLDFFDRFDIGIVVKHYNPEIWEYQQKQEQRKRDRAEEWLFKNAKL